MSQRIAIVGAGLSGLLAARELSAAGHAVRLFDKARGPGGRMSTRRHDALAFDHGAQYFTVRSARFAAEVDSWIAANAAARWDARWVEAGGGRTQQHPSAHPRYVGVPRMSAVTRYLARERDVVLGTRVLDIRPSDGGWALRGETGDLGRYDGVLVTTPPEQAAPLLAAAPRLAKAAAVRSEPCWAVMVAFDRPLEADFDGAFVDDARLAWAARNSSKPGRPPTEAWVLHGSPSWSRAHVDEAPEAVSQDLLTAFFEATGVEPVVPVHAAAHRWLLAMATQPREDEALWEEAAGIGACGDWLNGNKVEGAALSGLAVARRMVATTFPASEPGQAPRR